jgi:hypothetical protein
MLVDVFYGKIHSDLPSCIQTLRLMVNLKQPHWPSSRVRTHLFSLDFTSNVLILFIFLRLDHRFTKCFLLIDKGSFCLEFQFMFQHHEIFLLFFLLVGCTGEFAHFALSSTKFGSIFSAFHNSCQSIINNSRCLKSQQMYSVECSNVETDGAV